MTQASMIAMFPTIVYSTKLEGYEKFNKLIVDNLPNHGFDSYELVTGEPEGKSLVHCDPAFDEFFALITEHVKHYTDLLNVKNHMFDYFVTKSWYVIVNRVDHQIKYHMHSAGHISFVYYAQVPPKSDILSFLDKTMPNCMFDGLFDIKPYPDRNLVHEVNEFNCKSYNIYPEEGLLLLFPSKLLHGTIQSPENTENVFAGKRVGISGDFNMLLKPDIVNFESGKLNWQHWRKF
jgi:hypothetical protein